MRTEAPSPDVRIADRPCGLHRRFGYRRFLVSPVRPIAGFVLEALSPEFPSPEPHIAGRSIAGRFLMCYRRVSKSGDEIRRYQATWAKFPSSEARTSDTAKSDFPAELEVPGWRSRTCPSRGIQNKREKKSKKSGFCPRFTRPAPIGGAPVGDITVFLPIY